MSKEKDLTGVRPFNELLDKLEFAKAILVLHKSHAPDHNKCG